MPLWLLVPAALVAQTPAMPQGLDQVQVLVTAIPEALIEGKRGAMTGLVAKAKAGWDAAKPGLLKTVPEPDATFIDKQLKAMLKMKPREQAIGALGISATLSRFQGRSRKQDLLQASRVSMMAWCGVDAALWAPMPNVDVAFKPLIEQDNGAHAVAIVGVQDALKRFQESAAKRQAQPAKKALKDLMNLAQVLAKG
ncbi:hypothetical protein GETHLI_20270 [Geothrix limicola]|uniref:DUF4197 domain-containing protein n=1 Tax=Geothrix limicola TaxID=2927978 RepID=A0ABQ5QFA5_9BACT|nr:hypothetical protein [Geothrix limicola]GLH73525.1 hypothetical protein GETHLI_20270 [Geothrix limicola]